MSDIRDTYIRAVDLLARREHSERELATKLRQKGFESDQVDQVIAQLLEEGLLSNARYAESFIRARRLKHYGPLKIRLELYEKGISDALIESAMADYTTTDWQACMDALWQKKFANHFDGSLQEKAKCVRFFQYKGYPNDWIFRLIDQQVVR